MVDATKINEDINEMYLEEMRVTAPSEPVFIPCPVVPDELIESIREQIADFQQQGATDYMDAPPIRIKDMKQLLAAYQPGRVEEDARGLTYSKVRDAAKFWLECDWENPPKHLKRNQVDEGKMNAIKNAGWIIKHLLPFCETPYPTPQPKQSSTLPDVSALLEFMEEIAEVFDAYTEIHLAKSPPDEIKATRNKYYAAQIRARLAAMQMGKEDV